MARASWSLPRQRAAPLLRLMAISVAGCSVAFLANTCAFVFGHGAGAAPTLNARAVGTRPGAARVPRRLFGGGADMMEKMKDATMEMTTGLNKTQISQMEFRLKSGNLTFDDFLGCTKAMEKVSGNDMLMKTLSLDQAADKIKVWENIVSAMTPEERNNPNLFADGNVNGPLGQRIATDAKVDIEQVSQLVKGFRLMRNFWGGHAEGKTGEELAEEMKLEAKLEQAKTRTEKREAKKQLARNQRKTKGKAEPEWMKL